MTISEWAMAHWQLLIGAAVLAVAPPLIGRAWRRSARRRAARQLDAEARKEAADRKGRRIEDLLTLAVASAAAYLSSTGLREFGKHEMDLDSPLDWLPFISLDMAAVVCGMRARRRARAGKGPGLSGLLVWILIGTSASFSAGESLARAPWAIIAGILFELGSLEERLAARDEQRRSLGKWLNRKLAAIRLLHPIEWVRVQLALAADENISQEVATRQVRIERAGYRIYRLRQLAHTVNSTNKVVAFLTVLNYRAMRADRRAQVAQARVHTADLPAVLQAVQRRVRTRDLATLSYKTADAAEKALASLIDTRTDAPADTAAHLDTGTDTPAGTIPPPGTGTAPRGQAARTGTGGGSVPPGSGIAVSDTAPVLPRDTGTDTPRAEQPGTGTGPEAYRRTGQVGTGTPLVKVPAERSAGTDNATDEELVERLRRVLEPNGDFTTGGTKRTGRALGIGTDRARRVMAKARELGPLPSLTADADSLADAETGIHAEGATENENTENGTVDDGGTSTQTPTLDLAQAFPVAERLARPAQRTPRELAGVSTTVNGSPTD